MERKRQRETQRGKGQRRDRGEKERGERKKEEREKKAGKSRERDRQTCYVPSVGSISRGCVILGLPGLCKPLLYSQGSLFIVRC